MLDSALTLFYVSNYVKDIIADHKTLRKRPAGKTANDELNDTQFIQSTLPVHTKMFEKHRVHSVKRIMSTLLLAEIRYHAKVVEELSQVLASLNLVDDDDDDNNDNKD